MTENAIIQGLKPESPLTTLRIPLDSHSSFADYLSKSKISSCIISSTSVIPEWLTTDLKINGVKKIHIMNGNTPLPVVNLYKTPETLGTDRISSVIGAFYEMHCSYPIICIDSGTALTYDIINASGEYIGGNISPGVEMRFKSLHMLTKRLPLVSAEGQLSETGTSTESAIRNGVIQGIRYEILGYITHFRKKFPELKVFFTGGGIEYFVEIKKKYIFADKNLVLKGLNIILNYIQRQ